MQYMPLCVPGAKAPRTPHHHTGESDRKRALRCTRAVCLRQSLRASKDLLSPISDIIAELTHYYQNLQGTDALANGYMKNALTTTAKTANCGLVETMKTVKSKQK